MKNPSINVNHPQDFGLPTHRKANPEAAGSASEQPSAGEPRKDPWSSAWFRIQLEPFWNRFLRRGIEEKTLDAAHFKVFLLLTTLMTSKNEILQTQDEMAHLVKLKPSRVSEVLKDLEAMGWIQRIGGHRKGAFIRIDPELVTRASRQTHMKAIAEWEMEARRRGEGKNPQSLQDQEVPF